MLERVLTLCGDDDPGGRASLVRGFALFLLMHVSARVWIWAWRDRSDATLAVTLAVAVTACFALALSRRHLHLALRIAAALLVAKFLYMFPQASNHFFIELSALVLLALLDVEDSSDRELFLQVARWITVIVLFYTGLQKVLYGTYFDAQFLGYTIATKPSFTSLFAFLMPAEELQRLLALRPIGVGTGPFAVDAPAVRVVSNLVYFVELAAPPLLLVRRTRPYAVVAVVLLTVAIQAGAREIMFGALFVNLLLLFLGRPWNLRLLPAFAMLYATLFALRFGGFADVTFN